jgi:carbonic anhydrase/acetyltransferase-like protein (isoleucine patch superfamily)
MSRNPWISAYGDKEPQIHPEAFVDVSARIIGEVQVEEGASLWPMAVLRADSAPIRIGRRAAILDLSLLEAPEGHPVWVGEEALISHGAVIHGARVESRALVGIGAGSLVTAGTHIPPDSLVLGIPGKVVRKTTPQEKQSLLDQIEELHRKSRSLMSK